jgi:hypothetical protein
MAGGQRPAAKKKRGLWRTTSTWSTGRQGQGNRPAVIRQRPHGPAWLADLLDRRTGNMHSLCRGGKIFAADRYIIANILLGNTLRVCLLSKLGEYKNRCHVLRWAIMLRPLQRIATITPLVACRHVAKQGVGTSHDPPCRPTAAPCDGMPPTIDVQLRPPI